MRLLKNIITVGVMRVFLTLIIFLTDMVVSRYLGVALKGEYFFLVTTIVLLGTMLTGGLYLANIYYSRYISFPELAANSLVYLGVVGVILFAIGFPVLSFFPILSNGRFWLKGIFLACLLLECVGMIFISFFVAQNQLHNYAQIRVLRRGFFLLLLVLAWFIWKASLKLIFLFYMLTIMFALLLTFFRLPWGSAWFRFRLRSFGQCLGYGLRSQALITAEMGNQRLNAIFLGFWANPIQNGLYSVAINLGQGLWLLANILGIVIQSGVGYPQEQQLAHLKKLSRHILPLIIIGGIALALLAKPFIYFGYGPDFGGAGPLLYLMLPGIVVYSLYPVLSSFMIVNGQANKALWCSLGGLAVNVLLAVNLIPPQGAWGAAQALNGGYLTSTLLMLLMISFCFNVRIRSLLILQKTDIQNIAGKLKRLYSYKIFRA